MGSAIDGTIAFLRAGQHATPSLIIGRRLRWTRSGARPRWCAGARHAARFGTTTICFSRCCIRWRVVALFAGDIASPIPLVAASSEQTSRVLLATSSRSILPHGPSRIDGDVLHYDFLIVQAGASHSVFRSSRVGSARARSQNAGRCAGDAAAGARRLRSAPSANRNPARQRRLLTFVIVGGGPTVWNWQARLRRSPGSRWRRTFAPFVRGVRAHRPASKEPAVLPPFADSAAHCGAALARTPWR